MNNATVHNHVDDPNLSISLSDAASFKDAAGDSDSESSGTTSEGETCTNVSHYDSSGHRDVSA